MPGLSPRQQALVAAVSMLAIAMALRSYQPSDHPFYPTCLIHEISGLLCPGCGGTRAVAALLAGRWAEAASHNGLVAVFAPLGLIYAAMQVYSAVRVNRWLRLAIPRALAASALVFLGLFAIVRNIRPLL